MDPRRILVLADPAKTGIGSLVARIPGAREVMVPGGGKIDLPGIRVRVIDEGEPARLVSESKATLIISEKEIAAPGDLLLIPPLINEDTRPITDCILIWAPSDQGSRQLILEFLDQVSAHQVVLLTEGDPDQDIPLHAPLAAVSVHPIDSGLVTTVAETVATLHPSLIVLPKRIPAVDRSSILELGIPVFVPEQRGGKVEIRELKSDEFSDANVVWIEYHETKGEPQSDRVFAAFEGDKIVSLARLRRHPDGCEVDAVFTPEPYRGRGLSRQVVGALVEACYNEELTMYAVQHLKKFYSEFGFLPIPEGDLPASVRERYLWAAGNLDGAEVIPMKRLPARPSILTGSIPINRKPPKFDDHADA